MRSERLSEGSENRMSFGSEFHSVGAMQEKTEFAV